MEFISNPQLQLAFDFVEFTNRTVFLTGKAGTGKTTFLHNLKTKSPKRMIVVAPTGVAAINAGGVTIHSFFQLPFGPHIPENQQKDYESSASYNPSERGNFHKFNRTKINIIRSLDLLVIDEISMVRADLLDAVDEVLRRYRDKTKPFGGVQLLMIGDLQQLAPVAKEDEWCLLKEYYPTVFFFSSHALQQTQYVTVELKHIYRQSDSYFIDLLNKVRNNTIDQETIAALNKRYIPGFSKQENKGYITLTTHNYQAQELNDIRLNELPGKPRRFTATVEGDFPDYSYPTQFELLLKKNAQVMFIKNDSADEKQYYNGKIGAILTIDEDVIYVKCPGDDLVIPVSKVTWDNTKYTLDEETKEIRETVAGTFEQYPLKLAWAITIHKSQGLTFEKAIIDANAAFAHGQVYVALSRCKTLEGLVLSTPISSGAIKSDITVSQFTHEAEKNPPGEQQLTESKIAYQKALLAELFDFSVFQRRLSYCLKLIHENPKSLLPGFHQTIMEMQNAVRNELTDVADKFNPQLQHLFTLESDIEKNQALQERLIKASIYFADKTESILNSVLQKIRVETDNKAVRKSINEVLGNLRQDIAVKMACLDTCKAGFYLKNYQRARALAFIEKPAPIKRAASVEEKNMTTGEHPELYNSIREWRDAMALERNVAQYLILPQQTIVNLAGHLPVSKSELLSISGLGNKKVQQFGDEILSLIRWYLKEHSIEKQPQADAEQKQPKTRKLHTRELSYEVYLTGKTVEQIAALRGLTVGTIHHHLAWYVGTGELDINRFVAPEKMALILAQLEQEDTAYLGELKAALGDSVTYEELHYVLKYREFKSLIHPFDAEEKESFI